MSHNTPRKSPPIKAGTDKPKPPPPPGTTIKLRNGETGFIGPAIDNPYETVARWMKATKLADAFEALGWSGESLKHAQPSDWSFARVVCDCSPPSPETKELVVELLLQRQQTREYVALLRRHLDPSS